jgi:hypothetical protein
MRTKVLHILGLAKGVCGLVCNSKGRKMFPAQELKDEFHPNVEAAYIDKSSFES